ncbi:MAG: hypothetical protein EXR71_08570 [Myxococcales bacterium]|nr:hypothetical protein [Myxococcales bacterium]
MDDASPPADETLQLLLQAVESQLAAARTANAGALVASTEERRSLQETLDVAAIRRGSVATRAEATRVALRIRSLDSRIRTCGEIVTGALASLAPDRAPTTYTRYGLVRGMR